MPGFLPWLRRMLRKRVGSIGPRWRAPTWLSAATRGAGIGVWQWRIDEQVLIWDDAMYELYGVDPKVHASAREAWWSCVVAEDALRVDQEEQAMIQRGGTELNTIFRIRRGDGNIRHIAARCTIERDRMGQPVRIIGINEDVTRRVRTELRAQQYRLLAEQTSRLAHVAGWRLDLRTQEVEWTEGVYRIHDRAIGTPPTLAEAVAYYTPESRKVISEAIEHAKKTGTNWDVEAEIVTENERKIWVRVIGEPVMEEGACIALVGAIQDITDQRTVREELREAREQAEASNRAKSEFLANMSHELRTPLTSILGFASLAVEEPDHAVAHLGTIKRNGDHLLAVINDLLDLSKVDAGKLQLDLVPTDVRRLIQEMSSQYALRAREQGLVMQTRIAKALPCKVSSDPTRLRQVLHNLLGNALKFTDRGEVSLGVGFEPSAEHRGSGTLVLSVRDTGVGMTAEQLGRAFMPFEQADASISRRYGGTGLGLAITRRLVEMLGGTIEARSEPGEGSEFVVRTPVLEAVEPVTVAEGRVDALAAEAPEASEGRLVRARVLVVDDGADNRRLLSLFLSKAGAEVEFASDGYEAIEAAQLTAFDVILMDLQMPGMDGLEATGRLRELGVRTPIVAMTAHVMAGYRERCLAAGCDAYLTKPVEREALVAICSAVTSGTHRIAG